MRKHFTKKNFENINLKLKVYTHILKNLTLRISKILFFCQNIFDNFQLVF